MIGNSRVLRLPRSERDLQAIERETRATFVVLGQVQPVTEGIRVITHLIRLADGTHVWARTFVRREDDLANLDEAIAVEVYRAIRARVLLAGVLIDPRNSVTGRCGSSLTSICLVFA